LLVFCHFAAKAAIYLLPALAGDSIYGMTSDNRIRPYYRGRILDIFVFDKSDPRQRMTPLR